MHARSAGEDDQPAMKGLRQHQPPPAAVVTELVRAGVSLDTALAMERWKAQEVLDLLRPAPSPALGQDPVRRATAW